jgi:hypothetical protein
MENEIPKEAWEHIVPKGKYEVRIDSAEIKNGELRGTPYLKLGATVCRPLEYEGRKVFICITAWSSPVFAVRAWGLGIILQHVWAVEACKLYPGRIYEVSARVTGYEGRWYNDWKLEQWLNIGKHE